MEPGGDTDDRRRLPPGQAGSAQDEVPGATDSMLLAADSLLTLMLLLKAEAALAIRNLPALLSLSLYRLPAHLLAWISFSVLVASVVNELAGMPLLGIGTFAVLQLGLTLYLEQRVRQLRRQMSFPESRQGLALLMASAKARYQHDDAA